MDDRERKWSMDTLLDDPLDGDSEGILSMRRRLAVAVGVIGSDFS